MAHMLSSWWPFDHIYHNQQPTGLQLYYTAYVAYATQHFGFKILNEFIFHAHPLNILPQWLVEQLDFNKCFGRNRNILDGQPVFSLSQNLTMYGFAQYYYPQFGCSYGIFENFDI